MLRFLIPAVLMPISLTVIVTASPSHLLSRQTVPSDLPSGWGGFGCFEDNPTIGRSLTGASFTDAIGMTIEACVNFCNNLSFIYAGLEFGQECYCDNVFEFIDESVGLNECNQFCVGNPVEICGAPDRLSVYAANGPAVFPTLVPSVGPWVALGCYSDSTTARTLAAQVIPGSATVEACTTACMNQGFTLAGLEFGHECWCGSQILNGGMFVGNDNGISGTPPVRQAGMNGPFCNMACQGNSTELCGGSNRMNLYNFTGSTTPVVVDSVGPWSSLGCFVDSATVRTLRTQVHPVGGVTVESCTSLCFSNAFTLAGVEFGQECWCDTLNPFSGVPAPMSTCAMLCAGDVLEICGGPNALNIYQFQNAAPVLAALASSSSVVSTLTTLVNSATSSNIQTVGLQIVSGIQGVASSVSSTSSAAGSAVNSGRIPLTGAKASQALNGLLGLDHAISLFANALTGTSTVTILKPGFAQPVVTAVVNLSAVLDRLTQVFANEVIPSLSTSALSVQTDFDRSTGQMVATYAT